MKERIKEFFNNKKSIITTAALSVVLLCEKLAFAEDTATVTSITTSFQNVVNQTLAMVAAVAPIGITIFAAFFVWKKATAFFKGVTK